MDEDQSATRQPLNPLEPTVAEVAPLGHFEARALRRAFSALRPLAH